MKFVEAKANPIEVFSFLFLQNRVSVHECTLCTLFLEEGGIQGDRAMKACEVHPSVARLCACYWHATHHPLAQFFA